MHYALISYLIFTGFVTLLWLFTEERDNWRKTPLVSLGKSVLFGVVWGPFFVLFAIAINLAEYFGWTKAKDKLQAMK